MGCAHPELGFRLVVVTSDPNRGRRPVLDPVVTRPLGPGLHLEVTTVGAGGRLEPVRHSRCRLWGLGPAAALARARDTTLGLAADRHLWRLGQRCWLALLRAGPFTGGLVTDLARRVPDGDGHGFVTAPDPGTLAVVSGPQALDRAELDRAVELLIGVAGLGPGTIRWLIQFHPAGEFAIFGRGRHRPDHHLP